MTAEEGLIDRYVVAGAEMLARLGDHLVTLDELRESHKHVSLEQFGLDDATAYDGNLNTLVSSHLDRYDVHMATYLRYAHVILTYMVLENRLEAFGQLISATNRGTPFVPSGSLLQKFERYLATLGLTVPQKDALEPLRLVRNCIVHCRGWIDRYRERSALESQIPHLVGVSFDAQSCLTFTTEGCLKLQEAVFQYLQGIDRAAGFHMQVPSAVRENFERHIAPHLRQS
jgi:hypothetical protein